ARPYLQEEHIGVELDDRGRLRLFLPESLAPYAPTPEAAAGQEIQEWWPQGAASRPWRRVLNVVQMAWHDDPVNVARTANGRPPINGLWLYGGGRPADFRDPDSTQPTIATEFSAPAAAGDWAAWLEAAARLDTEMSAPMNQRLARAPLELVLTGEDRLCVLTLQAPQGFARWLPKRRHDWQSWWSPPRGPHAGRFSCSKRQALHAVFPEYALPAPRLIVRPASPSAAGALERSGAHPLLARLWAARGVSRPEETRAQWQAMRPPNQLTRCSDGAGILADAIAQRQRMLIVADYDCDGATACAVGLRALRQMGAVVDFLVPNRFETGYGLSPAVVELAVAHAAGKPDLIVTVDNGIASVDGVAAANAAGMWVLFTYQHVPVDTLPDVVVILNPSQSGCGFPSKNRAGVGVIFYLMLALRAELRRRGVYPSDG